MPAAPAATVAPMRKRAFKVILVEGLVAQAKAYNRKLSSTMEELLTTCAAQQQQARLTRQQ